MDIVGDWDTQVKDYEERQSRPVDYAEETADYGIMERARAIFSLRNFPFEKRDITSVSVSNNVMIVAFGELKIGKFVLENGRPTEECKIIELGKKASKAEDAVRVYKTFLSSSGVHVIVSLTNGDNYYINTTTDKPRLLSKMKGIKIRSVGWEKTASTTTTEDILIGTSDGGIYKVAIEGKEKYVDMIYTVQGGEPVTGIIFERRANSKKCVVIATTPTKVMQYIGDPPFDELFRNFQDNPAFHVLPGELEHSDMRIFSELNGTAQGFAWLTPPGVYFGKFVFGSQVHGESVFSDALLIPYPEEINRNVRVPLSLLLTKYHYVVLFEDLLHGICMVNEEVVTDDSLKGLVSGIPRGLIQDNAKNTYWLFTDCTIYEVVVTNETRNLWNIYLKLNKFDQALKFCETDEQRDKVYTNQAKYYFEKGNYDLAAEFYAKSSEPFEEVALCFLELGKKVSLMEYLQTKLQNLKQKDRTQITLLCTWIVELYLERLSEIEGFGAGQGNPQEKIEFMDEFKRFLEANKANLSKKTTFDMLSAHGRMDALLHFAMCLGDYEWVVGHHIQVGNHELALDVCLRHASADTIYNFSPSLIVKVPVETVNTWMRVDRRLLNPRKLLPALLVYDPAVHERTEEQNQAIRYLEYVLKILGNTDPAVHNFLISTYAKYATEAHLLSFLKSTVNSPCYDAKYALRVCRTNKHFQASGFLCANMGMYEESVNLALVEDDLELAKDQANQVLDDEELRKKLWLRIAKHVIGQSGENEKKGIQEALKLINECELLKIEDILPFFPDFTQIDDFKEEICNSLEQYNQHIEELKEDMEAATTSATLIRSDISELRNRYGFIGRNQKCFYCGLAVLARHFYLFPCQHCFHGDCLFNELLKVYGPNKKKEVIRIRMEISEEEDRLLRAMNTEGSSLQHDETKLENLRKMMDEMLSSKCPLCSDLMIDTVDKPMIAPEEQELVQKWDIF